jgi:sulfate/thiosulfate transport system substrate-binding protein
VKLSHALVWAGLLALCLYAVWPWLPGSRVKRRTIVVYGFSILGEAINEAIFPAFQRRWREQTGEQVELVSSFAGSGTVTNQIVLGVPAQVAILATELDTLKLEQEGRIPPGEWRKLPGQGILNRTPFVILVRPGNPKGIKGFLDLAQPGVEVVHPDPQVSGGAQWALLAEYGSVWLEQHNQQAALEQMRGIWRNVVAQGSSARAARTQFESGLGDALITYEQDLLRDQRLGKLRGEIVYPVSTILSEHTVMVLPHNVAAADQALVDAFVDFLWSEESQRLFASNGFRSLDERFNQEFQPIKRPFTVEQLGGWVKAKHEIVEQAWRQQVLVELGK